MLKYLRKIPGYQKIADLGSSRSVSTIIVATALVSLLISVITAGFFATFNIVVATLLFTFNVGKIFKSKKD